jgi:ribonuclease D
MPGPAAEYVHTPSRLSALITVLQRSERVALDTEFIGENAYEPLLCLVQVATEEGIWIVDPLAVADLRDFWKVLTEPGREVVAVAAREELRFCLRYASRLPDPLLDPQIAAGLVGYGYPLSHTNLVRKVLGVDVHGSEAYTDWRQRPLSNRQIDYAADDVRYLLPLRERLLADAERLSPGAGQVRSEWIRAECRRLAERITAGEQEERWWRVSGSTGLGRRELAVLRELWRWRDQRARAENIPPRRVLRDELLVEIAKRRPGSQGDLYALRGMDRGAARTAGPEILRAVQAAMKLPESELPTPMRRDDPSQLNLLSQLLAVAANNLAAAHHVDPALLATTDDLRDLVRWRLGQVESKDGLLVLGGWRGEILGEPLRELLDGKRRIRVGDLQSESPLVLEPLEPE